MMYHYRFVITYKGTNYFGWQDLGVHQDKPTIQASIEKALSKICNYENCTISAASRTDAGVHAQGQVAKVTIPLAITSEKLLLGMNSLLPDDIRILKCFPCHEQFNPNQDSTSKEYHYYFSTESISNPILNDIVVYVPTYHMSSTPEPLNIEAMKEACELFIGKHDFYSFAKRDTTMHNTFRTIISCEILQMQASPLGNSIYYLKIVGEGFLRYMVRYIVGTLFALGKTQLSLNDVSEALINRKEKKISVRAKSRGLHLIEITY